MVVLGRGEEQNGAAVGRQVGKVGLGCSCSWSSPETVNAMAPDHNIYPSLPPGLACLLRCLE